MEHADILGFADISTVPKFYFYNSTMFRIIKIKVSPINPDFTYDDARLFSIMQKFSTHCLVNLYLDIPVFCLATLMLS